MLQRLRGAPLLSPSLYSWQLNHPCSDTSQKGEAPEVYLNYRARGESSGWSSTGTRLVGRSNISQPWSKWWPRPGSRSQCKQESQVTAAGDLQLLLEHGRQLLKEDQKKGGFHSFCPQFLYSVAIVHLPTTAAGCLHGSRLSSADTFLKMNSVRWKDHFSLLTFSTT